MELDYSHFLDLFLDILNHDNKNSNNHNLYNYPMSCVIITSDVIIILVNSLLVIVVSLQNS